MAYKDLYQQEWIRDSVSITLEERIPRLEDGLSTAQKEVLYADINAWKLANPTWKQLYIDPYTMRRNVVVVSGHIDCSTGSTYGSQIQPFLTLGNTSIPLMKMGGWPNATDEDAGYPAYPTTGLKYFNRSIDLIDNHNGTSRLVGTWVGYSDWTKVLTGTVPST